MYKTTSNHPRGLLRPTAPCKRKERDGGFDALKPSQITKLPRPPAPRAVPEIKPEAAGAAEPCSSNQLLAGYLANEFLTRGTLFGQRWDPSAAVEPEPRPGRSQIREAAPRGGPEAEPEKQKRYAEIASLLKAEGAHLPGVVNPTQLARLLRM